MNQPSIFTVTLDSVGTTGTQRGGTVEQLVSARMILQRAFAAGYHKLRHGDCIGWDEEIHAIALEIGFDVIIHPPDNDSKRAFCTGAKLVLPPKPYLERNHDIVDASVALIAGPGERLEQLRSGTWATIRYARTKYKKIYYVLP